MGKGEADRYRRNLGMAVDAAFLYRRLAGLKADTPERDLYLRLAEGEDLHTERWRRRLQDLGAPPVPGPSRRARPWPGWRSASGPGCSCR